MRRRELLGEGEYYHLLGRGNNKQKIFLDERDHIRFLFCILYFQAERGGENISRMAKTFAEECGSSQTVGSPTSDSLEKMRDSVVKDRRVELMAFCLMPNHYHLLVKNVEEDGISKYMQRVLTSYTKYFNTKYERSGHLFQDPYKAVHIASDKQLQYLSAYIHRNPRELKRWRNKEHKYPWSSFQDYINENRWNELLVPDIILESHKDSKAYKKFVDTSSAKLDTFVNEELL